MDVRYLPSGIFGRPPIYDVCCEAPSLSCDPQSFSGPAYRSFIAVVGKVRGATFQSSSQRGFQCRDPKSKPPPVEPTGVSNKVDDKRRAPKPGGPSRTLQHHESRSRAAPSIILSYRPVQQSETQAPAKAFTPKRPCPSLGYSTNWLPQRNPAHLCARLRNITRPPLS